MSDHSLLEAKLDGIEQSLDNMVPVLADIHRVLGNIVDGLDKDLPAVVVELRGINAVLSTIADCLLNQMGEVR